MRWPIAIVVTLVLIAGLFLLTQKEEKGEEEKAIEMCINLCKEAKERGLDLSNGPCLSNNLMDDWVCDVAHWPRIDIDNKPENQCSAFREGRARNFVEVDENCRVIKVYYNGRLEWYVGSGK